MARQNDFKQDVKELLARRVGMRCSNPNCRQPTSGPAFTATEAVNIGVAAHITAASPGGARYDPSLTNEERRSVDNGIWCCQNCAKLIDNDSVLYTVDLLRKWKRASEEAARLLLDSPKTIPKKNTSISDPMFNVRSVLIRTPLDFEKTFTDAMSYEILFTTEDRDRERQFRQIVKDIFQDLDCVDRNDIGMKMCFLETIEEPLAEMVGLNIDLFCVMLPMRYKDGLDNRFEWDVANYFFVPKGSFYASGEIVTNDVVVHQFAHPCSKGLKIWMQVIRHKKPIQLWDIWSVFNREPLPTWCETCCTDVLETIKSIQKNITEGNSSE